MHFSVTMVYVLLLLAYYNSTGGHVVSTVSPLRFYCATKFAITAIAEGVRQELREMKSNCRATVSIISLLILLPAVYLTWFGENRNIWQMFQSQ